MSKQVPEFFPETQGVKEHIWENKKSSHRTKLVFWTKNHSLLFIHNQEIKNAMAN